MTYSILLVDDEMPALRFMQAIIDKYLPEFTVAEKATSGPQALDYLRQHPVDLLMTDISMPGMDGITLAKKARELFPNIHIVIVSGYAEFEYARGALIVAADDYLLKPLSVPNTIKALQGVAGKLTAEYMAYRNEVICELATSSSSAAPNALLSYPHCFALIRWGNLRSSQPFHLLTTHIIPSPGYSFIVLQGVDEDEKIVVSVQPFDEFRADFLDFAASTDSMPYTAVLNRVPMPLSSLHEFIERAAESIDRHLIIGKQQLLYLEDGYPELPPVSNPNAVLRKIEHFTASGNMKMVKETFINMAAAWEKQQYTQQQIATMVYSLVQQVLLASPALTQKQERIMREASELLQNSSSYGSLIAGLYDMLFDENDFHDKNLAPKELCEYIMTYIRQNFAKQISIQSVCSEIGVSQTYMSRLLRRYAKTSFSAYLTQCRVDAAMNLIRQHPDILLRDVASCVGYDDPSYFSKVFHQVTQKTPTQFAADQNELDATDSQ